MKFRSKNDIKNIAASVLILEGFIEHKNFREASDGSFTFSLETRKRYYGNRAKDRAELIRKYGDGGTLYVLSPWNNPWEELEESDALEICEMIVRMGYVPFIGVWYHKGRRYEEPSFAIDHGISEAEVYALLEKFGQKAALMITPDCKTRALGSPSVRLACLIPPRELHSGVLAHRLHGTTLPFY